MVKRDLGRRRDFFCELETFVTFTIVRPILNESKKPMK